MSATITPMRLNGRAEVMRRRIVSAETLLPELDRDYLVKGWFDRGCVSVVYGAANVGKSFFAADLAHHVHEGLAWGGCRVRRASALYVATEGGRLFVNRLSAMKAKFWLMTGGLTLASKGGDAPALADAATTLADSHGPAGLIVLDTLARTMGASDENLSSDMGLLLSGVDMLRERTGAHIMLIHHSGKAPGQGARGHSSLRAAVDTEVEITAGENGVKIARATKQRDMAAGKEFLFRLRQVDLGADTDGDPVTTCRVEWVS